jgi:glucose/arabinose dehydrogenase
LALFADESIFTFPKKSMTVMLKRSAIFLIFFLIISVNSFSAQLPGGFREELLVYGLNLPTTAEFSPDGRLFILEKNGTIRIFKNGALLPKPFLKVPVSALGEQGLLGIAFHPQFRTNGYFYLYRTTRANPSTNIVERYQAFGDQASFDSRVPIIEGIRADGLVHNAGCVKFGPDGKLYVSTGDSTQGHLSQSLSSLNAKILRVNPDGTIPADNPFANRADARPEVFCYGLRNPWRFVFHPISKLMVIGDVGDAHYEEINIGIPGANYGWPISEGPSNSPDFVNPAYAYDHSEGGAAVTPGFFYTGKKFPGRYSNKLFFSDFARNFIKTVKLDPSGVTAPIVQFFATDVDTPVHLTQAPDGSFVYVSIYTGEIRRVWFAGGKNRQPSAKAGVSKRAGPVPLGVKFNARGSSDPDGDPLTYFWDFGDGQSSTLAEPFHTYQKKGNFFSVLTVRDSKGAISQARSLKIVAGNNPPRATILTPTEGKKVRFGDVVRLSGRAVDPEDGPLNGESLIWSLKLLHNDHSHPYGAFSGNTATFVVRYPENEEGKFGFRIQLRAVDSGGLNQSDFVTISIER